MASRREKRANKKKFVSPRRNQERQEANALARKTAAKTDKRAPERARYVEMLDLLHGRGSIDARQYDAGYRLQSDFHCSGQGGKLVSAYEFHPSAETADITHAQRVAMVEYQLAMQSVGPRLSAVVCYVCLGNGSPGEWAKLKNKPSGDGMPLLREGLDALVEHYVKRSKDDRSSRFSVESFALSG